MTAQGSVKRDWLAELRATDTREEFASLVREIAKLAPGLEAEVCEVAAEVYEGLENWTREFFASKRREATEEGGTIRKRDLMQEPETKPKWDHAKELDAAVRRQAAEAPLREKLAKLAAEAKAKKKFSAEAQPAAEPDAAAQPEPEPEPEPETAKPEPEREAEPEPEASPVVVSFSHDDPIHDRKPPILSTIASYDNARVFAQRHCWKLGSLGVYAWLGNFWEWNGRTYRMLSDLEMRSAIYRFLDGGLKVEGKGNQHMRFQPKPSHANELLDGLRSGLTLPDDCDPPIWLDTGRHAGEVMVFANGLVEVATGAQRAPTPKLWAHGEVGYDWNPDAPAPQWQAFLESVFPGDREAQDCAEELTGLSMTEDIGFQKGAMLCGPPRSGKGTLLGVNEALVGSAAYIGLDMDKWNVGENSREPLIARKVLAFPDVRLRPPKWYGQRLDPGGLDYASVQLLLKITSGDGLTIGRKYKPAWTGKLPGKIWIAMNDPPNFNDAVLPTRFVKLAFEVSFLGREDNTLLPRLKTELSGIAGRCLAAYHRAKARGRLIQPRSAQPLEDKIARGSNPFAQFVQDTFVADPAGSVLCGVVWRVFEEWRAAHGNAEQFSSIRTNNIRKYINAVPGFEHIPPSSGREHGEKRRYQLMRLRKDHEKGQED